MSGDVGARTCLLGHVTHRIHMNNASQKLEEALRGKPPSACPHAKRDWLRTGRRKCARPTILVCQDPQTSCLKGSPRGGRRVWPAPTGILHLRHRRTLECSTADKKRGQCCDALNLCPLWWPPWHLPMFSRCGAQVLVRATFALSGGEQQPSTLGFFWGLRKLRNSNW